MKDIELLTVAEAAERCRVSEPTFRQYIRSKQIKVVVLPGKAKGTRIALSELQRFWSSLPNTPPEVSK